MSNRPNILFITADQWRGDALGVAGHACVKTPHLDALAAKGARFTQHYAAAAPCSPARAALYTGLHMQVNRVTQNGTPLDARFDNIAKMGRRAGYEPTLFGYTDQTGDPRHLHPNDPAGGSYEGVLPGMIERARLGESEAQWHSWLKARGHDPAGLGRIHEVAPEQGQKISLGPTRYSADETPTAYLAGEFLRWMDEQDETPWFAHLSFIRPHPPLAVPAPYNDMYNPDEGPDFNRLGDRDATCAAHPLIKAFLEATPMAAFVPGHTGGIEGLSETDLRRLRAIYYGMITEVDAQLGRIFASLKAAGLEENTLIIFTSDHGEMMGDHWLLGKGIFFPEAYHIPLIMAGPEIEAGSRIDAFTSAVDIFPTLAATLGVAPLHTPNGADLTPLAKGQTPPDDWRDAAYWEYDYRALFGAPTDQGNHTLLARHTQAQTYVHCPGHASVLLEREHGATRLTRNPAAEADHRAAMLDFRTQMLDRTLSDQFFGPQ